MPDEDIWWRQVHTPYIIYEGTSRNLWRRWSDGASDFWKSSWKEMDEWNAPPEAESLFTNQFECDKSYISIAQNVFYISPCKIHAKVFQSRGIVFRET